MGYPIPFHYTFKWHANSSVQTWYRLNIEAGLVGDDVHAITKFLVCGCQLGRSLESRQACSKVTHMRAATYIAPMNWPETIIKGRVAF